MRMTKGGFIFLLLIILASLCVGMYWTIEAPFDMDSFMDSLPSGNCGGGCKYDLG